MSLKNMLTVQSGYLVLTIKILILSWFLHFEKLETKLFFAIKNV